jgi:hypothetical protein
VMVLGRAVRAGEMSGVAEEERCGAYRRLGGWHAKKFLARLAYGGVLWSFADLQLATRCAPPSAALWAVAAKPQQYGAHCVAARGVAYVQDACRL